MSQNGFAARFGILPSTLRDWEQNRRHPDGAARVLLMVIDKEPDAVFRALAVDWLGQQALRTAFNRFALGLGIAVSRNHDNRPNGGFRHQHLCAVALPRRNPEQKNRTGSILINRL